MGVDARLLRQDPVGGCALAHMPSAAEAVCLASDAVMAWGLAVLTRRGGRWSGAGRSWGLHGLLGAATSNPSWAKQPYAKGGSPWAPDVGRP